MTKWQKGLMATQLYQMGLLDEEGALDALEYPNREEILQRMEERKAKEAEMMAASGQQPGGGGKGGGFGRKAQGAKLPANLLRGGNKQMGMQEPQG